MSVDFSDLRDSPLRGGCIAGTLLLALDGENSSGSAAAPAFCFYKGYDSLARTPTGGG